MMDWPLTIFLVGVDAMLLTAAWWCVTRFSKLVRFWIRRTQLRKETT